MNVLLHPFSTLHETYPFHLITPSNIREAAYTGMEEEDREISQIVDNEDAPNFENTIVALSKTGKILERATTVMYNLLHAETNDELDALANELAPMLSEHSNNIMLNAKLYERVQKVYSLGKAYLSPEEQMLLEKTYVDFERSGATLDKKGKARFREITGRLSELTLKFSQNLLKATNAFVLKVTKEEELSGLPEIHRKAAAEEAASRGEEGWFFTLHAPSYVPFMTYADNRELREKLYRAYSSRCAHEGDDNNFEVVREIVNLRRELAQLLGYKHFADYALRRRMAEKVEAVEDLLNSLIENYYASARAEVERVKKKSQEIEGPDFKLMPWDFSYFSQKLKQELYDYDPDMLRPYFELSKVKNGVLALATRLYGITFKKAEQIAVFHEDVEAFEVFDKDGTFLSVLYLDFFPRASKQGGAWMTSYKDEECLEPRDVLPTIGNTQRPHVSVTTNFTKPTADTPALLTLAEVETFLHEFGHALHGIFAQSRFASLSGTSVFWDFVELPSQFMENYASEPDFLSTFARHFQTGESLPEAYVERIRKARNFNAAYSCMRQVSFGLLDLAYYTLTEPFDGDIRTFENKAWRRVKLLEEVDESCMSVQFSHIMAGGYAAGYYSYKWAEVLDADAFSLFQEQGIFNRDTAESFRQNILSRGGTEPPMKLYMQFRGRKPTINALLHRDGII